MAFEVLLSDKSKKPEHQAEAANVSFADLGSFDGIKDYIMECPDAKLTMNSKLFLKDLLKLTGMEMSFGYMEPDTVGPFSHKHIQFNIFKINYSSKKTYKYCMYTINF